MIFFLKFRELKLETVSDIDLLGCRVNGGCNEEIEQVPK